MTRSTLVDSRRSACLCDVGAPGLTAAACVDPDGQVDYALIRESLMGDPRYPFLPWTPDAPHEQLGALPIEFVRRITAAAHNHRGTRDGGNR
jgi:hypothetical protein